MKVAHKEEKLNEFLYSVFQSYDLLFAFCLDLTLLFIRTIILPIPIDLYFYLKSLIYCMVHLFSFGISKLWIILKKITLLCERYCYYSLLLLLAITTCYRYLLLTTCSCCCYCYYYVSQRLKIIFLPSFPLRPTKKHFFLLYLFLFSPHYSHIIPIPFPSLSHLFPIFSIYCFWVKSTFQELILFLFLLL